MGSFRHLLTIPVHWFRGKRIKKKNSVQIKKLEPVTKSIDNAMKTIV